MSKREFVETERIANGFGYDVQCAECGAWFESTRFDAAFCSSTCRSRWHRSKQATERRIERAQNAVESLIDHLPKTRKSITFDALLELQKRISSALASVEDFETALPAHGSHADGDHPDGDHPDGNGSQSG